MSDISRRDAIRRLATVLAATGTLDSAAAREVHQLAAPAGGSAYKPHLLTRHEFETLVRLTDLIIPVENGSPGAVAAGCAEWIDTIASGNPVLTRIYKDGLKWLDAAMVRRGPASFVRAPEADQLALLDTIAYRRNRTAQLEPGIEFFTWVRRMTVDAFYTSEIGIRDIDYRGNTALAVYPSPTESIGYALKRSGL